MKLTFMKMSKTNNRGFTIIELMVSTGILTTIMAMLVGFVLSLQNNFFNDVVRTRVNSNLRSALDIMGMNIRQSGENLNRSFPVVVLTNDSDGVGSYIQLRRNLIPEVLTVCSILNSGASSVDVSSTTAINASCIYGNVTSLYNAFNTEKNSVGGSTRIFIYNSLTKAGEFVDYTGGTTTGTYSLNISAPSSTYQPLTTYLYIIEEYAFSLQESTETLNLYLNGKTTLPESVAFGVTGLNFNLKMDDDTTLTSMPISSAKSWKEIKAISITLTGSEERKTRTFTTSLTEDFFPRNVISR